MRIFFDSVDELDESEAQDFLDHLGVTDVSIRTEQPMGAFELTSVVTDIVLSAGSVAVLARTVLGVVERFRRAVVVDCSGDEVEIRPDRSLPRGTVLVVEAEGRTARLEHATADSGAELAEVLRSAVGSTGRA